MTLAQVPQILEAAGITAVALGLLFFFCNREIFPWRPTLWAFAGVMLVTWYGILLVPYHDPNSFRSLLDEDRWWYSTWIPRLLAAATFAWAAKLWWYDEFY